MRALAHKRPMPFGFFKRPKPKPQPYIRPRASLPNAASAPAPVSAREPVSPSESRRARATGPEVRRYFHNHSGFQCYTTWFSLWGGWASAGHCVSDAGGHAAGFASDAVVSWPDGLDAALAGCTLPPSVPAAPRVGQRVVLLGYPAGSRHLERREGVVYHMRLPGQWIVHIEDPDEPVVVGMSGGPVLDAATQAPIGIVITRNSPADLNADRDPDESADFIALADVWAAMRAS